jgi:four helix bundle protein
MAKRSSAELASQLDIALKIGFLLNASVQILVQETEPTARVLNSLINRIKGKTNG